MNFFTRSPMIRTAKPIRNNLRILSLACLLSACAAEYETVTAPGPAANSDQPTQRTPSSERDDRTLCDPFSNNGPVGPEYGIEGIIKYLDDQQPRYSRVEDFEQHGHLVEAKLFLNDLNVPTRHWESGFVSQANTQVKNEQGELLTEYFYLDLKSRLALLDSQEEGDYQLAILSDDGSVFNATDPLFDNNNLNISNNRATPTRMTCASSPLNMRKNNPIDFRLQWFQGPRTHIALILMWRKWPTDPITANDPLCDQFGNFLFFDWTVSPSEPSKNYEALLSRGWKVVEPRNYVLPSGTTNQCHGQENP